MRKRTYATGVADQLQAAAAADDKTAVTDILQKVFTDDPAAAIGLAEGVLTHGIKGVIARRTK